MQRVNILLADFVFDIFTDNAPFMLQALNVLARNSYIDKFDVDS